MVTEGEKKTLCAVQHGFACVGLAGVWNWSVGKDPETGQRLPIPDLDAVDWKSRTVYIAFDSDAATNYTVQLAEWELSQHLNQRGAQVRVARIPKGHGNE